MAGIWTHWFLSCLTSSSALSQLLCFSRLREDICWNIPDRLCFIPLLFNFFFSATIFNSIKKSFLKNARCFHFSSLVWCANPHMSVLRLSLTCLQQRLTINPVGSSNSQHPPPRPSIPLSALPRTLALLFWNLFPLEIHMKDYALLKLQSKCRFLKLPLMLPAPRPIRTLPQSQTSIVLWFVSYNIPSSVSVLV